MFNYILFTAVFSVLLVCPAHAEQDPNCFLKFADLGFCPTPTEKKWSYNVNTEMCEEFDFGPCGETPANRFDTEQECADACVVSSPEPTTKAPAPPTPAPTTQPPAPEPEPESPCDYPLEEFAKTRGFGYNKDTNECEIIKRRSGFEGNANHFKSMNACKRKCVEEDKEDPACMDEGEERVYYDSETNTCESGMGSTQFGFGSMNDCSDKCVKQTDPCEDRGASRGDDLRYFYDDETNSCADGLGHAQEGFGDMDTCEDKCLVETNPCDDEPSVRGKTGRVFYLKDDNMCVEGRASSTDVGFADHEDCEKACVMDPCSDKPGKGKVRRFFYQNKMCLRLKGMETAGFANRKDCEEACIVDPCSDKPGKGKVRRFFYNAKSNKCSRKNGMITAGFDKEDECNEMCVNDEDEL